MASILTRLYRIARSAVPRPREKSGRCPETGKDPKGAAFEGGRDSGPEGDGSRFDRGGAAGDPSAGPAGDIPPQVVDDLAVFDLVPPSSLEAVRKARNREVKKYHSDRFLNDPERFETSKRIMQIYNAAYDRLETYYQTRKP